MRSGRHPERRTSSVDEGAGSPLAARAEGDRDHGWAGGERALAPVVAGSLDSFVGGGPVLVKTLSVLN
ncbi:hypothetical protein D3C80_1187670 [compost metagenome]